MALSEGTKYDDGKLPLDLWSQDALYETARVLQFGAAKYEPYNWAKGIKYSRVFSALLRHLWAFWRGEKLDNETGLHHLGHAMCCLMFLLHYEMNRRRYREFDDRPKGIYARKRVSKSNSTDSNVPEKQSRNRTKDRPARQSSSS